MKSSNRSAMPCTETAHKRALSRSILDLYAEAQNVMVDLPASQQAFWQRISNSLVRTHNRLVT